MPNLSFRPLHKSDFAGVAAWIGQPHVQQWWHEPPTVEHVAKEYGACTRGDLRTRVYIVRLDSRDIGMIQCYLTNDWPQDTAGWEVPGFIGIDYLIGEPQLVGRGLGSAMIAQFVHDIVRPLYPEALGVVADPETANHASIRALQKAGFTPGKIIPEGEYGTPEQLMMLRFNSPGAS